MDSQNPITRTNEKVIFVNNSQYNQITDSNYSLSMKKQIEVMLDKIIGNENEDNDVKVHDDEKEESFSKVGIVNTTTENNNDTFNSILFVDHLNNHNNEVNKSKKIIPLKNNLKVSNNSYNDINVLNIHSQHLNNEFKDIHTNSNINIKYNNNQIPLQPQIIQQYPNKMIIKNQHLINNHSQINNQYQTTFNSDNGNNKLNFQANNNKTANNTKLHYGIKYHQSNLNFIPNQLPIYSNTIINNSYSNNGTISIHKFPILNNNIIQSNNKPPNETYPQFGNYSVTLNSKTQNKIHKDKDNNKFGTSILSKGTNMQIETILYELNTALSKTEKIDYYIYNKLHGRFIEVIKTHKGSKIFQNYLKHTQSDIIHQIFVEICSSLPEIISNSYANYFCKRFFTHLNQKDRIEFLVSIQPSLIELSMNSIGTYPIQGIIEQVGSKIEKKLIVDILQPSIKELCCNIYGAKVLEKIIICFEEEFSSFIYEYISNNFLQLANNANGICLVKRILTLTHKRELHETLKRFSFNNAFNLTQNIYGNYVIQVIIEYWEDCEINELVSILINQVVFLSMQKYSSNVIERLIEKSENVLSQFINKLYESKKIVEVMKNNFGNYVIQKALKISKGNNKKCLLDIIVRNIYKLNDKKLIIKWKSIVSPYLQSINILFVNKNE